MEKSFGERYVASEDTNWWCIQRRSAILSLLKKTPKTARILEIGCCSGALVELLSNNGFDAEGCDISASAIRAGARRKVNLFVCDAAKMKSASKYDVVVASDVLEHIKDDTGALKAWGGLLRKGGKLIVFVPAFQSLWSRHDDVNRHHRRYKLDTLEAAAHKAGFSVERSGYWNFLLFVPAWLQRRFSKATQISAFEGKGAINAFLNGLLAAENKALASGLNFPFGVSCFAVLRKK